MSPLPSKSLIKSHEPITSPSEIAANGNFHHPSDATMSRSRRGSTSVRRLGFGCPRPASRCAVGRTSCAPTGASLLALSGRCDRRQRGASLTKAG